MEKLLQKARVMRNGEMSFFRHEQNRYKEPRTSALGPPYLINIFLVSCSPAELTYASVDKAKCKAILGLINKKYIYFRTKY